METDLFSKHPEWPEVLFILQTLHQKGHQAVLAGGCVRDALLGKVAKDLDIATNATPDKVESYFQKVLPLGKSFGVCRVISSGASIEVATFREEFDYKDGRRPSKVEFSSLEKDAERRDFTINALFYDVQKKELIDLIDGEQDLKKKQVRCVGDAERRFGEDYLRILRGVRFAGQLDFAIEEKTFLAILKFMNYLPRISQERIYDEINKMFVPQGVARCTELLLKTNIFKIIFPSWDFTQKLKCLDQEINLLQTMRALSSIASTDSIFGWTAMYHLRLMNIDGKSLDKELLRLKLPHSTIDKCKNILAAQNILAKNEDEVLSAFIALALSGCILQAEIYWGALDSSKLFIKTLTSLKEKYFVAGQLPPPLVTGHDLIRLGIGQGPKMKVQLQALYVQQLKDKKLSKKDLLS